MQNKKYMLIKYLMKEYSLMSCNATCKTNSINYSETNLNK